jgi:RNA polymerase sigma-70 factor (ECF subfamily)
MQPLSNKETLRGFNRREDKARNWVYELYHDALLIMIRRITQNSPDTEDLVNDSFEILYGTDKVFNELSELRDFLFQAGKNTCINYLDRIILTHKKYAELQKHLSYTEEDFYADICYSETRSLLYKQIENLPDKLKMVFRLRYFEDLPNEEVAGRLNIAVKTVYKHYLEARQKLKWDYEQVKRFTVYLLNLFL